MEHTEANLSVLNAAWMQVGFVGLLVVILLVILRVVWKSLTRALAQLQQWIEKQQGREDAIRKENHDRADKTHAGHMAALAAVMQQAQQDRHEYAEWQDEMRGSLDGLGEKVGEAYQASERTYEAVMAHLGAEAHRRQENGEPGGRGTGAASAAPHAGRGSPPG